MEKVDARWDNLGFMESERTMKYVVSVAVDGRLDVDVEADSPEGAFEKAYVGFYEAYLEDMEVVDFRPVNCTDEKGVLTDA